MGTIAVLFTQRFSAVNTVELLIYRRRVGSGVDITVIALWLGPESPTTTHMYLEAYLYMKMARVTDPSRTAEYRVRYRPTDRVRQFLQSL